MARTPSRMLPLGTPAPAFALSDTDGNTVSIDDFADAPDDGHSVRDAVPAPMSLL